MSEPIRLMDYIPEPEWALFSCRLHGSFAAYGAGALCPRCFNSAMSFKAHATVHDRWKRELETGITDSINQTLRWCES